MTYRDEIVDELLKFRGYCNTPGHRPTEGAIEAAEQTVNDYPHLTKLEAKGTRPFHAAMIIERWMWSVQENNE